MEIYRYLFYRLFLITRSWQRDDEQPEWGAASGITCLIILNAISVAMAAELIAGLQLDVEKLVALGAIVGVGALVINYRLLVHSGRGRAIVEAYDREARGRKPGREVAVWSYVLGSVAAFLGMAIAL